MKITRDLIEKYHLSQCTAEERDAVEQWLGLHMLEEETASPVEDTDALEKEIWTSLAADIQAPASKNRIFFLNSFNVMAAAASLAFILSVGTILWWYNHSRWTSPVSIANMDSDTSNNVEASGLRIAMAPQSRANITTTASQTKGNINFCGAISIESIKDVELTLNFTCSAGKTHTEKMTARKGETYIAFNYRFASSNELLVVNTKDIADLPPLLRRQFTRLFKS